MMLHVYPKFSLIGSQVELWNKFVASTDGFLNIVWYTFTSIFIMVISYIPLNSSFLIKDILIAHLL